MYKLSNPLTSKSIDRLKLLSAFAVMMAWLIIGSHPAYATMTRICGSTGIAKDIGCGGTFTGGIGGCDPGQYCCNESHTCGDSLMMLSCARQKDICEMPAAQSDCTSDSCATKCADGQYCCQHGMKTSCDSNLIGLEFFPGCRVSSGNICLQEATPTPTPTPSPTPTPTATPTPYATPTPTETPSPSPSPSPTPSPTPTISISGSVNGGESPVASAAVTLYAASTNYGATPSALATATTDGSGNFTVGYVAPSPAALLYFTVTGGNAGNGANTAIGLAGIAGPSASPKPSVVINELTTVATEYALAQFADTTGQYIGAPSTNATGLANAAALAQANLADFATGDPATFWTTYGATPANCANNPAPVNCDGLERMNTLANILAACIQSVSPFTDCTTLLGDTGSGSNTLQAAHYMAVNPATNNLSALFALQADSGDLYAPYLGGEPDGFELALNFTPTGSNFNHPNSIAIDADGDPWIPNSVGNTLTELSPTGALLANYTPTSPPNALFADPVGVAIDLTGNVFVTNDGTNSVTELASNGTLAGYYNSSNASGAAFDGPYAIAIDKSGNAWVTNLTSSSVSELLPATPGSSLNYTASSPTGADFGYPVAVALDAASPFNVWVTNLDNDSITSLISTGTSATNYNNTTPGGGDLLVPDGIALDSSADVWVPNFFGDSVTELAKGAFSEFVPVGADFDGPYGIAIDSGNYVWITNSSSTNVTELDNSGDLVASFSPAGGNFNSPFGIAIDASGNLWITNNGGNSVAEFIGAASPVLTPPVACLNISSTVCKP